MSAADDLRDALTVWGQRVFELATTEILLRLDQEVPRGGVPSVDAPRLADSRTVTETGGADQFGMEVAYSVPVEGGDVADFTEFGTAPHLIFPKGKGLRFEIGGQTIIVAAKPFPGSFVTDDGTLISGKGYVDHPGSHLHDGWFSSTCSEWPEILQTAADSV